MKYLYLIALILTAQAVYSQQQVSYFKLNGQSTAFRDSALYARTITETAPGSNLYNYTETFITGEIYRTGQTTKFNTIVPEGENTIFYLSGKKQATSIYNNNKLVKETVYYPNGVTYLVKEYTYTEKSAGKPGQYNVETLIITCNDSTGKTLVKEGTGHFVLYLPPDNPKFNNPNIPIRRGNETASSFEEGNVKEGKADGEWKGGHVNGLLTYTENYNNGELVIGRSVDKNGKTYTYKAIEAAAEFPGGLAAFGQYLGSAIRYPTTDRQNALQGKVFVSFVIDKDGSLTDIKVIRAPSETMGAEAVRVLKECPKWRAGTQHGIPVRQQFTVPITFSLAQR